MMMRKTFKSTIPGFELNEEMAHKGKKKKNIFLLISVSKYKREKDKLKKKERTQEPKTEMKSYSIFTIQQISHVRNYHKMHFLLS